MKGCGDRRGLPPLVGPWHLARNPDPAASPVHRGTSHVTEATRFALSSQLVGAATGGHRTRGQGWQLGSQIPEDASDRPGVSRSPLFPEYCWAPWQARNSIVTESWERVAARILTSPPSRPSAIVHLPGRQRDRLVCS